MINSSRAVLYASAEDDYAAAAATAARATRDQINSYRSADRNGRDTSERGRPAGH
ncbi:hypothetical protein SBBP2_1310001 [Burkholderiales bacterium]|nr:hypothetical protein SBBP2_1310001 [Burkholderiales bacterium]